MVDIQIETSTQLRLLKKLNVSISRVQPSRSYARVQKSAMSQEINKHPLVQNLLVKMEPLSPVKLDADKKQSQKGDIKQLRKEKYEIQTPLRQLDFQFSHSALFNQNGIFQEDLNTSEVRFSSGNFVKFSEQSKSQSINAQDILFMKNKNNTNCVPSSQTHVDFSNVKESSLLKKRKSAHLRKLTNQLSSGSSEG